MGSCCCSSIPENYGFLYLELDKLSAFPGEEIQGYIYLNLLKDFPGSNITLNLEGEEFCQWPTTMFTTSNPVKKNILSKNVQIYSFPEGIAKSGDYSFPISFLLDNRLPATYSFTHSNIKASISYNIIGCLNSYNTLRVSNLLYAQSFTVLQPKIDDLGSLSRSVEIKGKSLWVFSKGYTKLKASLNKNNFKENENCHVNCKIDNKECNLEVESIEIKILRILVFKSDKEVEFSKKFVLKKVQMKLFLPPNHQHVIRHEFDVQLQNEQNDTYFSSTIGSLVKNHFFVQVSLNHNSMGTEARPQILIIPILIHHNQRIENHNFNNDYNDDQFERLSQIRKKKWNPQEMPQNNFIFGNENLKDDPFNYPKLDEYELLDHLER